MQKVGPKENQVELKYLSEWKDQLKELFADRTSDLKGHLKSPKRKVLDQPDVKDTLNKLHANYVLVPADKAANNVIIVCKKYYTDTLVKVQMKCFFLFPNLKGQQISLRSLFTVS